jgi:xanthosine utilization system XapX-like protein
MNILIFNIFCVRSPSQPIIVVHGQVDVYVYDGANIIHEQRRPHLTSTIGVPFEELSVRWKPSVPSKGHPSNVCVAVDEWV